MAPEIDVGALDEALARTRERLLAERGEAGHWAGELSTSALSTATAVVALSLAARESRHCADAEAHGRLVRRGLDWIASHVNADGGWGDTVRSRSNMNTTALCWAALAVARGPDARLAAAAAGAERWLSERSGGLDPARLASAILAFYGDDRTFSTPILTLLALTGRLGPRAGAFAMVPQLPFELAAFPQSWYRMLRLPVVSYALPALVAIGQVRHRLGPAACPLARIVRRATRGRTLRVVRRMQPASGGFLEAIPLTSFVTACLAAAGVADHAVVREGARFLRETVRADGGWPIDTDLATWVTTLSVNALASGGLLKEALTPAERRGIADWLLAQQHAKVHPFTGAEPGGWGWSDRPGSIADADDTPGALIALHNLAADDPRVLRAARMGVRWLLRLQNRDGGVPTFCRGWNRLPFDRSAADITAHTARALALWSDRLPEGMRLCAMRACRRALACLARSGRADGSDSYRPTRG